MNILLSVIYSIVIVLGSFLFVLLAFLKHSTQAFKIISVYVFGVVLSSIFWFSYHSGFLVQVPHLLKLSAPFFYVFMPSAFIAVKMLLTDKSKVNLVDLLLYVPAIAYTLQLLPVYFLPVEEKIFIIRQSYVDPKYLWFKNFDGVLSGKTFHYLGFLFNSIMMVFTFLIINKYSNPKTRIQKNSQYFSLAKGIFYSFVFVYIIYFVAVTWSNENALLSFFFMMIVLSIPVLYLIIFFSIHPQVFYGESLENQIVLSSPNIKRKTEPVANANIRDLARVNQIDRYLLTNHLYLNPDFTMSVLSEKINLSPKLIRSSIMAVYHQSFNDYINTLRINYFVSKISSKSNWNFYSVRKISTLLGYKSPVSFYNSFKKIYQITPKDFIEKHLIS